MRLQPNAPRLITVVIALVLGVIGFVFLWPVEPLVSLLNPIRDVLAAVGLKLDHQLASLFLAACPTLLAVGSLVREPPVARGQFSEHRPSVETLFDRCDIGGLEFVLRRNDDVGVGAPLPIRELCGSRKPCTREVLNRLENRRLTRLVCA